ncbi:MAG: hypothetical protein RR847_00330 [Bacilli bacterium]
MKKDIPKVYANMIDKDLKNNERVVYSKNDFMKETVSSSKVDLLKQELKGNINQKIQNIFSSKNYIYKADVIITLRNEKITKRIIGRNSNHIITYDNELIPIVDIIDIEYK